MARRPRRNRLVTVPLRTCVACRRSATKRELIRLVCAGGTVRVDPSGTRPGRGAYLCGLTRCTDAALRRNGAAIHRALRLSSRRGVTLDTGALRAELRGARDGNDEYTAE